MTLSRHYLTTNTNAQSNWIKLKEWHSRIIASFFWRPLTNTEKQIYSIAFNKILENIQHVDCDSSPYWNISTPYNVDPDFERFSLALDALANKKNIETLRIDISIIRKQNVEKLIDKIINILKGHSDLREMKLRLRCHEFTAKNMAKLGCAFNKMHY